jgi:hypothetical protein
MAWILIDGCTNFMSFAFAFAHSRVNIRQWAVFISRLSRSGHILLSEADPFLAAEGSKVVPRQKKMKFRLRFHEVLYCTIHGKFSYLHQTERIAHRT